MYLSLEALNCHDFDYVKSHPCVGLQVHTITDVISDVICFVLYRCRELNVNKNHFTSFKQLPKIPQIQHLSLAENNIVTLSGISEFRHTPLESLILRRNPCEFQERYRQL